MPHRLNSVKIESAASARNAYHHGDLRAALIAVGEAVLAERGPSGFSLREVARRAGVSPAAPSHHFANARGLLSAIAASGFARLADALTTAGQGGEALREQAAAYVAFALDNPALFSLMWMQDVIDNTDPDYLAAGREAFNRFERVALGRAIPVATGARAPSPAVVAAWSMIHGFARLALDGALGPDPHALLAPVLDHLPETREEA